MEFEAPHWPVFENAIDMAHIHYLHSFGNSEKPRCVRALGAGCFCCWGGGGCRPPGGGGAWHVAAHHVGLLTS
jgi:hypothetical protein